MTMLEYLLRLVTWITVEPVEFLYCLMFTTSNIVRDNLFILKVGACFTPKIHVCFMPNYAVFVLG